MRVGRAAPAVDQQVAHDQRQGHVEIVLAGRMDGLAQRLVEALCHCLAQFVGGHWRNRSGRAALWLGFCLRRSGHGSLLFVDSGWRTRRKQRYQIRIIVLRRLGASLALETRHQGAGPRSAWHYTIAGRRIDKGGPAACRRSARLHYTENTQPLKPMCRTSTRTLLTDIREPQCSGAGDYPQGPRGTRTTMPSQSARRPCPSSIRSDVITPADVAAIRLRLYNVHMLQRTCRARSGVAASGVAMCRLRFGRQCTAWHTAQLPDVRG